MSRSNHWIRVAPIVAAIAFASFAAHADGFPAIPYELQDGSTYQQGCFPPCQCPLWEPVPMEGTFALSYIPWYGPLETVAVTGVDWTVPGPGLQITGSGIYQLAGDLHQMTLDLQIDGGEPEHFNSGLVPGGDGFPLIDITLTRNDFTCFDIVLHVVAAPVELATPTLWVDDSVLVWSSMPATGEYDVICGDLDALKDSGGDFSVATDLCLGSDHPETTLPYALEPTVDQGMWFLVRGAEGSVAATYDSNGEAQVDTRNGEVEASPLSCP